MPVEEQTATLRDTVAKENPTVEAAKDDKVTAASADEKKTDDPTSKATVLDTADKDAAEIGRILLDSGFSKDQLNDLMEAPRALEAIRAMVNNDPKEFLKMLERTDPQAARNFHEQLTDMYVERYASKDSPADKKDGEKSTTDPTLMQEIKALREEVTQAKTEQQRRDMAAATAQVKARYDARVEDIFGQEGVKNLGLTKSETKAMRAQLDQLLASDPQVVRRISNGNFVDVPKAFKGIIDEWTSDKKAAIEAEKNQRESRNKKASPELSSGPNPFTPELPAGFDDSWDSTEAAFVKALETHPR